MIRKLKQHRQMCGLRQCDLAKLSGVSVSRIAFAESGRVRYTRDEIVRIQRVLRDRAAEIVGAVA